MVRKLLITTLTLCMICLTATTAFADEPSTAKSGKPVTIGENGYSSFKEAYDAAKDGETIVIASALTEKDVKITLDKNVTIKLDADLTLEGKNSGDAIGVAGDYSLTVSGSKTMTVKNYETGIFNGDNDFTYAISLKDSAKLAITECKTGIMANGNVTINVGKGSILDCSRNNAEEGEGNGICFTDGKHNLNIEGTLRCNDNGFDGIYMSYIKGDKKEDKNDAAAAEQTDAVTESFVINGGTFEAKNNENSGLVGNYLHSSLVTLKNGGKLIANDNEKQGTLYVNFDVTDSLITANRNAYGFHFADINSSGGIIEVKDNSNTGWITGLKNSHLDSKTDFTATGNSSKSREAFAENEKSERYMAAVLLFYTDTALKVDEGANFKVKDNYCSGIRLERVSQKADINAGTITGNGFDKDKDSTYGGGIYNKGTINIGSYVKLCNNHAEKAGDDIYSATDSAVLTFAPVGSDWKLTGKLGDCKDAIDGWYDDAEKNRWAFHVNKEDRNAVVYNEFENGKATVYGKTELKAAHGVEKKTTTNTAPAVDDGETMLPAANPVLTPAPTLEPAPMEDIVAPKL